MKNILNGAARALNGPLSLAGILAGFEKTLAQLEELGRQNEKLAAQKRVEVVELERSITDLDKERARAGVVGAKIKELIS